jgi:hypothetical protein
VGNDFRHQGDKVIYLAALRIQTSTFLAFGLAARALPKILCFDVIAGVTLGIIVMDTLFNGVPRCFSHFRFPPFLRLFGVWVRAEAATFLTNFGVFGFDKSLPAILATRVEVTSLLPRLGISISPARPIWALSTVEE